MSLAFPVIRTGQAHLILHSFREHALKAFVDALRESVSHPPAGVNQEFQHYFADLATTTGMQSWLRHCSSLQALGGGIHGKVVLDVGSGFGLMANMMGASGAAEVVAIEQFAPRLDSHRVLLDSTFSFLRNVHPVRASASVMPVRSGSADFVLSNEAISHYFDVDGFLDECVRVLRPGGWLVIADGNNGANPSIRMATEELWSRMENGPVGPCGTHHIDDPMSERRVRIIREHFPELPVDRVRELALGTSGLDRAEILAAVEGWRQGGPAPSHMYRRGMLVRDPIYGQVEERLFTPQELGHLLSTRGFSARIFPHYGGARGGWVRLANEVLRRIPTFRFARGFRVAAQLRAAER